jgi:aromatic-L-amino-acid/L-tryptophan decarboxylase
METKDFRAHAHDLVNWIADYFENIEEYPVKSQLRPGDCKSSLPENPPVLGEPFEKIMNDFQSQVIPGISHWQHPGWFAYFPANSSPVSVLAEMLTAALGVQGMIWETSPAATELEEVVMNWLRDMIGLPDLFTGVIQDTASTATLCALLSARERITNYSVNQVGFQQRLRVYASTQSHSSIEKGVKIAGFGKENLVYIDVDDEYAMKADMLLEAIQKDIEDGFLPCCVVGSLGTTSSAAMDPIEQIGNICRQFGIWFHIDAAFAGTAAMVPELRGFMNGADLADSFVFNPHKWMLTNFDCSAYFVRDAQVLRNTFAIMPEYLKTSADSQVNNYRDWGVQLGRRFRSLKLWFVIRYYGEEGIQSMIRKHVMLARKFAGWIEKDPDFEILAPVNLSLVCFRYVKNELSVDELNDANKQILEKINSSGEVFLTHTVLSGKYCIRLAIGQRTTDEVHVRKVFDLLKTATGR